MVFFVLFGWELMKWSEVKSYKVNGSESEFAEVLEHVKCIYLDSRNHKKSNIPSRRFRVSREYD